MGACARCKRKNLRCSSCDGLASLGCRYLCRAASRCGLRGTDRNQGGARCRDRGQQYALPRITPQHSTAALFPAPAAAVRSITGAEQQTGSHTAQRSASLLQFQPQPLPLPGRSREHRRAGLPPRGPIAVAMKDLYEVLGVDPGAEADEIKKAYRRQALVWHPGERPPPRPALRWAPCQRRSRCWDVC